MRQNVKRFIIAYNEINRWYDRVQNFQHRYSFVNSGFLFCSMAKWMNLLISTNAHHARDRFSCVIKFGTVATMNKRPLAL